MKTMVDQTACKHVRVREAANRCVSIAARANDTGLGFVCRHLLAVPTREVEVMPGPNASWDARVAYARAGHRLVSRLRPHPRRSPQLEDPQALQAQRPRKRTQPSNGKASAAGRLIASQDRRATFDKGRALITYPPGSHTTFRVQRHERPPIWPPSERCNDIIDDSRTYRRP